MPTAAPRSVAAAWVEPTSLLPLRWGHYRDRYVFGLILIIGGAVQLQGSNTYTIPLLLIGTVAHITGWSIMPARGWRRLVVVVPATAQMWLTLTGPLSVFLFTIPFLCWMLVRHRPLRSYIAGVLPLANGFILPMFFTEYSQMPEALTVSLLVLVASAWLARVIAASATPPSESKESFG